MSLSFGHSFHFCTIFQAARLVLPNFDCPPLTASKYRHFLESSSFSCSAASKSIILGEDGPQSAEMEWAEHSQNEGKGCRSTAGGEFDGWTPLCWAIALARADLVERIMRKQTGAREAAKSEMPLKVVPKEYIISNNLFIHISFKFSFAPKLAIWPFVSSCLATGRIPSNRLVLLLPCRHPLFPLRQPMATPGWFAFSSAAALFSAEIRAAF
jgi:hypothetical protein